MSSPTLRAHRHYQRRLRWYGIIAPKAIDRPYKCTCGHTFTPTAEGVTRWPPFDGTTIWQSQCPSCNSHVTVHSIDRGEP